MEFRTTADSHVHTNNSPDARDPAKALCASALEKGISDLTVTDHCDCNVYFARNVGAMISQSFRDTAEAASEFRGKLRVHRGLELGQPLQDLPAAEEALASSDLDFVLASVHNLRGERDFYYARRDSAEKNLRSILSRYFREVLETVEWGRFDSLAHLTYPWRYLAGREGIPIPEQDWSAEFDAILRAVVRKGKALELNTSGFRQELGVSMPDLPVFQRYRELGGELVTIGSDAHRREDVGADIGRGLALLKQAGFRSYAVYEAHRPVLYAIESVNSEKE